MVFYDFDPEESSAGQSIKQIRTLMPHKQKKVLLSTWKNQMEFIRSNDFSNLFIKTHRSYLPSNHQYLYEFHHSVRIYIYEYVRC